MHTWRFRKDRKRIMSDQAVLIKQWIKVVTWQTAGCGVVILLIINFHNAATALDWISFTEFVWFDIDIACAQG